MPYIKKILLVFFTHLICIFGNAQSFSFHTLFSKNPLSFDSIIAKKNDYRLQIIYTQINRDENNQPTFTTYTFDADCYYYYCASIFKLPAAVFALEKLNELQLSPSDSFSLESRMCPAMNYSDSSFCNFGTLIQRMLMVSDNDAFNPLYDFITPEQFNKRLQEIGYKEAVLCRRFAGCDSLQNMRTNRFCFYDSASGIKCVQDTTIIESLHGYNGWLNPNVGKQYYYAGKLIKEPFNFSRYNYISLSDAHDLLMHIVFPNAYKKDLNLRPSDYKLLMQSWGTFPREADSIKYPPQKYPDNFMKYFVAIDSGQYRFPENLRVYNKVGLAYGFMTDCSYVQDTLNKVEFFLSASMYVNKNETLNDGKYEYATTALPFFRNLFNAIHQYELLRKKKHLPIFEKHR